MAIGRFKGVEIADLAERLREHIPPREPQPDPTDPAGRERRQHRDDLTTTVEMLEALPLVLQTERDATLARVERALRSMPTFLPDASFFTEFSKRYAELGDESR